LRLGKASGYACGLIESWWSEPAGGDRGRARFEENGRTDFRSAFFISQRENGMVRSHAGARNQNPLR